jgi:hypothetical protein
MVKTENFAFCFLLVCLGKVTLVLYSNRYAFVVKNYAIRTSLQMHLPCQMLLIEF